VAEVRKFKESPDCVAVVSPDAEGVETVSVF
jgi:hypothetical protein